MASPQISGRAVLTWTYCRIQKVQSHERKENLDARSHYGEFGYNRSNKLSSELQFYPNYEQLVTCNIYILESTKHAVKL